jgi:spore germination cell wall hydrolase CwlJ-like protein
MKTSTQIALGTLIAAFQVAIIVKLFSTETSIRAVSRSVSDVSERVKNIEETVIKKTDNKTMVSKKEFDCLARNVFFEAGVEDLAGKIAVAQVTMNRAADPRWGKTICKTVYARSQFSWTLQKKKVRSIPKGKLWDRSVLATNQYLDGYRIIGLENGKFYHTHYIKTPKWADKNHRVGVVGQHIFYSEAKRA